MGGSVMCSKHCPWWKWYNGYMTERMQGRHVHSEYYNENQSTNHERADWWMCVTKVQSLICSIQSWMTLYLFLSVIYSLNKKSMERCCGANTVNKTRLLWFRELQLSEGYKQTPLSWSGLFLNNYATRRMNQTPRHHSRDCWSNCDGVFLDKETLTRDGDKWTDTKTFKK